MGFFLLCHAYVSNAMCNCNVSSFVLAASNGKCDHGKSHENVVAIVAVDYRQSTINMI